MLIIYVLALLILAYGIYESYKIDAGGKGFERN